MLGSEHDGGLSCMTTKRYRRLVMFFFLLYCFFFNKHWGKQTYETFGQMAQNKDKQNKTIYTEN
jgi:hypothetical protein